ncbi:L-histidine N(alpha)-methyltransferase [Acidiferrimicrobium sp. IK]|uniref:L-histidine N(alpha)-methyltransferase n=1 Tax=Acidiferrimicrobium sp. IK TaxID=2871700 RepID=UPI0021CB3813|nr:L-histidine N(alpha)-methyltransferase [Acidiferrimicrobium sp. IK]MCU4184754.1 L-histidine N(alpha)-methyltransferase [Acidiferrimicrobium sp. IK]
MTTTDSQPVEVHLTPEDVAASLASDVRVGLTSDPKWLPAKWLYDQRGCELFEAITELPEYYPTRAERALLAAHAPEIAAVAPATTLIELGSGTSEKTRLLIAALQAQGSLRRFVAFDVAEPTLRAAVADLSEAHEELVVEGIVGDFERHLDRLSPGPGRMVAFLGGTIGNFDEPNRLRFFSTMAAALEPGEWLLLGTDLVKDPARLVAAYDDAEGVTAAFETNVLAVLNHELGADFDLERFGYVARWDPDLERIEMGVRSLGAQSVRILALDMKLELLDGEEISTEVSAKFRRVGVSRELAAHGFEMVGWWTDPDGDFAVSCARRSEAGGRLSDQL